MRKDSYDSNFTPVNQSNLVVIDAKIDLQTQRAKTQFRYQGVLVDLT